MTQEEDDGTRPGEDISDLVEWMGAFNDIVIDGYTGSIAAMLRKDTPVPVEVRWYLAALIEGKAALPDTRGKKNTALTPSDRESVEKALFRIYWGTETVLVFVHELADEQGVEVIDLQRQMERFRRDGIGQIASKFDLSEHTVKKYHDAGETIAHARHSAGDDSSPVYFRSHIDRRVRSERGLAHARAYLKHPHLFLTPFAEEAD